MWKQFNSHNENINSNLYKNVFGCRMVGCFRGNPTMVITIL